MGAVKDKKSIFERIKLFQEIKIVEQHYVMKIYNTIMVSFTRYIKMYLNV